MFFVMDIGNTNIKNGLFENGVLTYSWRTSSTIERTADEMGLLLKSFFDHISINMSSVEGIIVSSVRPSLNYTIEHMCELYFNKKVSFVGPGIKTGINIKYENAKELGADRICNAVAAYNIYGGPCITVDFGTATTFGVVSKEGDFLGGAICPGIKIAAEALVSSTARLPNVELIAPKSLIGKNTVHCIQSGLIYGYIGQVDYIVRKLIEEIGEPNIKIVATGGMAKLIVTRSQEIGEINSKLTLLGLNYLYELNKKQFN